MPTTTKTEQLEALFGQLTLSEQNDFIDWANDYVLEHDEDEGQLEFDFPEDDDEDTPFGTFLAQVADRIETLKASSEGSTDDHREAASTQLATAISNGAIDDDNRMLVEASIALLSNENGNRLQLVNVLKQIRTLLS